MTPLEILRLEEEWLDSVAAAGGAPTAPVMAVGTGTAGSNGIGEGSAVDDVFWGTLMGFFWPLGALVVVVMSDSRGRRRGLSVFVGVLVNFVFGVVVAGLRG